MKISFRSAAAQLGISHVALQKRVKHGKVTWPPVSMEAMAAEWEANKDAVQQQRGARITGKPLDQQTLPLDTPSLSVSQAREAALRVEERQFKLAMRRREVLRARSTAG